MAFGQKTCAHQSPRAVWTRHGVDVNPRTKLWVMGERWTPNAGGRTSPTMLRWDKLWMGVRHGEGGQA